MPDVERRSLLKPVKSFQVGWYEEAANSLAERGLVVRRMPLAVGDTYSSSGRGGEIISKEVKTGEVILKIAGSSAVHQALEVEVENLKRRDSIGELGGWD